MSVEITKTKPRNLEMLARWFVLGLVIGLPLAVLLARWLEPRLQDGRVVEIRARMPENGGWNPTDLEATVGETLHLRLIADDVMHGFAIGQSDLPVVDMKPGEVNEIELTFNRPGKYTFYCTRWCGANHWRMRGTIEVRAASSQEAQIEPAEEPQPLFLELGIDIDSPHQTDILPAERPSAPRGAKLQLEFPPLYLSSFYYQTRSPAEIWQELRASQFTQELTDIQVWDLVATLWFSNTNPERLETGERLYAENCAACHGEAGAGDGVMAGSLGSRQAGDAHAKPVDGHTLEAPTDFTDASHMLGASPALLQGKILRGGMGTGMPYWGPVFTTEQVWALVDYLWTFQFNAE